MFPSPVQYHRALARGHCTAKEEELIRFGMRNAVKAIDNALGEKAERHFGKMTMVIDR
jgi:hypothetical protein